MKLKTFISSMIALLLAVLVSIILIEKTIVIFCCLLVALVGFVITVVRCVSAKHSRRRVFVSTAVPIILFVLVAGSHLPLRVAFHFYRPRFEQAVSQIEAGASPVTPFRIGPFMIKMVGRREGSWIPYLATNEDSYEVNGFVRNPEGYGFNLWSCITLDDSWSYIAED